MSAHEEEVEGEVGGDAIDGNEENSSRLSPQLLDEKIKASLELYTPDSLSFLK